MMTKQEQINEMLLYVPQTIVAYDANPKGQHLYGEQRQQIAKALYDAGYRKVEGLEKGNADLLKACEEQFTFDTTEGKKYSIFNSVRKELADRIKVLIFQKDNPHAVPFEEFVSTNVFCGYIDELLEEYKK